MLEENFNAINKDLKALLSDSQALLQAAATLTGDKAEEVRAQGMKLLDVAMHKAQETQANAVTAGKQIAKSADGYAKENPWKTIATGASIGLLLGVILGRR